MTTKTFAYVVSVTITDDNAPKRIGSKVVGNHIRGAIKDYDGPESDLSFDVEIGKVTVTPIREDVA